MMRGWFKIWPLWLLIALFPFVYAEGFFKNGIPLIIPGSELAWEADELKLVVRVEEPSEIKVLLYSPGFDPNDYRSPHELGDERYDRGQGDLLAVYELRYGKHVITRKQYGIEPHAWHELYAGRLEPGEYTIAAKFYGNGKNAVVFSLKVLSGKAKLQLAPDSMQTYNVVRDGWQTPFMLEVPEPSKDLKVGIYDGDGPQELEIRANTPRGVEHPPVPGNREWTYIPTEEPGRYSFSFRIPSTATQHTNTVGFQVFLGKIQVEIVDVEGRPVPGASYRITGEYRRLVELLAPPGWELVKTEIENGRETAPGRVVFGMGSGRVRFVLKRIRPMGTLVVRTQVACGDYRAPYGATVRVGDQEYRVPASGELRIELPQGVYPLSAEVPGAVVEGDARVRVVSGAETRAELWIKPQVKVSLALSGRRVVQGERVTARAKATTEFPGTLPAELRVELPEGLSPEGPTSIQAPLSAKRSVELSVPVRAERPGEYRVQAVAGPCGGQAEAELVVMEGPRFAIEKTAVPAKAAVGEEVAFRIVVTNRGDTAGRVRVVDPAPAGFKGPSLDEWVELAPGERWERELAGKVSEEAGAFIENRAELYREDRKLAEAQARVEVLRPEAELSCTVDKPEVLPGEEVHACFAVANPGRATLRYRLGVRGPDWVELKGESRFSGELKPEERTEHCVTASVKFGPEAEGAFVAELSGNAGKRTAQCQVRRKLLGLKKTVEPERVLLGHEATYVVRVENPLDRPVKVRLLDLPAEGLGLDRYENEVELPAGDAYELERTAVPTRVGKLKNQASVYIGEVPAAMPVKAVLEVVPPLRAHRTSTVELPFKVEAKGDGLLIRHAPPEGARYRVGSSRLDGKPIADPRVDDQGRLYWKLPFVPQGVLSYELEHERALPKLPEPELTLLIGDRELPLKGDLHLKDYEAAKPIPPGEREGLIRTPLPGTVFRDRDAIHVRVVAPYGVPVELLVNGEPVSSKKLGEARYDKGAGLQTLDYYAVKLKPGKNVLEVRAGSEYDRVEVFLAGSPERLVLIPERTVADGRTPLTFRIEEQDALGIPTGRGFVTVEAQPEPMDPDAAPMISGYQVSMKDGVAKLRLEPMATPGWVRVRAAKDDLELDEKLYVEGPKRPLYLAQGSITVRYGSGGLELGGLARGYVESPLSGGYLQGAVDYAAGEGNVIPDLEQEEDPTGRFPLTGSGSEAKMPLVSEDGVAFRYDRGPFTVGYGRFGNFGGLPSTSVLMAEYRGEVHLRGFVGLYPREVVEETLIPDGSRVYQVSRPVRPGTDKVYLERGGERIPLARMRDYTFDYPTGTLYLSHPLWPSDEDFVPQTLVVVYAPETAPRDKVGAGVSLGYSWKGFSLEATAATLGFEGDWRFGAKVGYREQGFGVSLTYGLKGGRSSVGLSAYGRHKQVSVNANLHYAGQLTGRARIATDLGSGARAVLEHQGRSGRNQTSVLYEQRFGKNLFAGLGAGYIWEKHAVALLGRAGYRNDRLNFSVTHSQPFAATPETALSSTYAIDENLKLRTELAYRWGEGLAGVLGLEQKLGAANLSLSYQLPGAGGSGNRARFGIRAPWPIAPHWNLDLSATYERALSTGEFLAGAGVGVRYSNKGFRASLGVEGSTSDKGDKLSLRAGAAGQIDKRQVLSFDATYQVLPEARGRFSVAYAFRGRTFQFLTYHRYTSGANASFEGELAATWHPSLAFQLRPSAAYRMIFADPAAHTYQVGLGANYYFTPQFGLGAGGYYILQPAVNASYLAFSVEGSLRVLDPIWLNLGYTFGGFEGLTPEARPGWYLRLDLFGTGLKK